MSVLVSGSIAIDNVKTQKASQENLLGGSASYAAIAASFFGPSGIVGVVGHDFPEEHLTLLKSRDINLEGLWKVLDTPPTYNGATIHTDLTCPASGEYRTYKRHGPLQQ